MSHCEYQRTKSSRVGLIMIICDWNIYGTKYQYFERPIPTIKLGQVFKKIFQSSQIYEYRSIPSLPRLFETWKYHQIY